MREITHPSPSFRRREIRAVNRKPSAGTASSFFPSHKGVAIMNSSRRRAGVWCLGLLLACGTGVAVTLTGLACSKTGDGEEDGEEANEFVLPRGPQIFEELTPRQTGIDWGYKNDEEKEHLAI